LAAFNSHLPNPSAVVLKAVTLKNVALKNALKNALKTNDRSLCPIETPPLCRFRRFSESRFFMIVGELPVNRLAPNPHAIARKFVGIFVGDDRSPIHHRPKTPHPDGGKHDHPSSDLSTGKRFGHRRESAKISNRWVFGVIQA